MKRLTTIFTFMFSFMLLASFGFAQQTDENMQQKKQQVEEMMQDSTMRSMIMEQMAENPKMRKQMMQTMRMQRMQKMMNNPEMKERMQQHMKMMQKMMGMMEKGEMNQEKMQQMMKENPRMKKMMQRHMMCMQMMQDDMMDMDADSMHQGMDRDHSDSHDKDSSN